MKPVTDVIDTDNLRKELEEVKQKLKDKEMVFDTILESTLAGYWDWYIQEDQEYLSPTFKSMFGYEDHELPNSPETWQKIIHPDDLPLVFEVFEKHVKTKGKFPYDNEVRYHHKDGSIVWVYCRGKVIEWDEQGKPLRMLGCHINITPLKEAEKKLNELNTDLEQRVEERTEELEKSNKQLQEFAYVAAHDLKAPVTNLRILADMIDGETIKDEQGKELFDKLQVCVEQLHKTVFTLNDVITFKTTLKDKKERMNFEKLFGEIQESIAEQLESTDTVIEVNFSKCPEIDYPPVHLRSILQNLLTNTIKYKSPDRRLKIVVKTTENKGRVCLTVKDNGLGFDAKKYTGKMMGLFKRLHTHVEGKGIGLYIVKSIVDSHSGKIQVESKPDKGALFTIYLNN